jgi:hypothetical protein
MPLHHPAIIETLVLDHVPVAVRLAVLLSLGASQKHDAANLNATAPGLNVLLAPAAVAALQQILCFIKGTANFDLRQARCVLSFAHRNGAGFKTTVFFKTGSRSA